MNIKKYERDGYYIFKDFISASQCEELIQEAKRLVETFDPQEIYSVFSTKDQERISNDYFINSANQVSFFFETGAFDKDGKLRRPKEESINKIGHALHDLNPIFNQFSRQPRIKEICQTLNVAEPLLMQSMYIFKQPFIGGEVTCHQDSTFLYTDPESTVGFWFALQDATISNGCMYALPGGHCAPLKRRFRRDRTALLESDRGHADLGIQAGVDSKNDRKVDPEDDSKTHFKMIFQELDTSPWPSEGFIPLEVPRGTLILLHGRLPHLSGANTSPESRHAYTLHVVDGAARYSQDNWLQRKSGFPASGF